MTPTALTLTALNDLADQGFDDIIDVRAPAEFAIDHLPGAINLPVLDDGERALIGTIYTRQSPFRARKLGAALVARNAARHLEGPLIDKPGGWRPLVYCWRGGQRSGSFATILAQVGWRVKTVAGGYKSWRALVVQALYDRPVGPPVVVLDGNTGTAKTEVLALLARRGVQVVDLEGLARHRGSLFGTMPGGQPSQKAFESGLALALARLDPARPVLVEAESSKVGECRVPPGLWAAMIAAPRIAITAALPARTAYLTRAYGDLATDGARLTGLIDQLRPFHAAEVITAWQAMAAAGEFSALAAALMAEHYDPRYEKHRDRRNRPSVTVTADSLDALALADLADRIAAAAAALTA